MHGYAMPKFFGRAATRPSKVWQNWRAHLLMSRKFFGSAVAPPSRKPLAIRYSPLAAVLAEVGVYENEACYLGCVLRVES
jgi:hypothetical protein